MPGTGTATTSPQMYSVFIFIVYERTAVPTPEDIGLRLLNDVGRLNRWATHRSALPLPVAQLRLLALVDQLQPARVGELAAADHSTQPSVTATLNRTDAQGWTTRTADSQDSRAQIVTLTAAGRDVLDQARNARADTLAPVLAAWSDADLDRLDRCVHLLDRLLSELEPERNLD